MKTLVTIPHTGTRFVTEAVRACGIDVGHYWTEADAPGFKWSHFNEAELPLPSETITLLRSPLSVLATHDQEGFPVEAVISDLGYCYAQQMTYLHAGCAWSRVDIETIETIMNQLGIACHRVPVNLNRHSAGMYPLKASLAKKSIGRKLWNSEALLDWWLSRMVHVDLVYARHGYDIWWRQF